MSHRDRCPSVFHARSPQGDQARVVRSLRCQLASLSRMRPLSIMSIRPGDGILRRARLPSHFALDATIPAGIFHGRYLGPAINVALAFSRLRHVGHIPCPAHPARRYSGPSSPTTTVSSLATWPPLARPRGGASWRRLHRNCWRLVIWRRNSKIGTNATTRKPQSQIGRQQTCLRCCHSIRVLKSPTAISKWF